MKNLFVVIILSFLFVACASAPRFTSVDNIKFEKTEAVKDTIKFADTPELPDSVLAVEIGIASYYAEPFHGRKTANGEIYNMYDLTAAHPTFPLGTIARATNLKNGKSVIIKINDRMPKHPERIIDLSYGTAKALGFVNDGLAKIKLEILKWGDNKYISPNKN